MRFVSLILLSLVAQILATPTPANEIDTPKLPVVSRPTIPVGSGGGCNIGFHPWALVRAVFYPSRPQLVRVPLGDARRSMGWYHTFEDVHTDLIVQVQVPIYNSDTGVIAIAVTAHNRRFGRRRVILVVEVGPAPDHAGPLNVYRRNLDTIGLDHAVEECLADQFGRDASIRMYIWLDAYSE